ncbi:hypothetical protein H0H93_009258, partial [Arthromyces matolae]
GKQVREDGGDSQTLTRRVALGHMSRWPSSNSSDIVQWLHSANHLAVFWESVRVTFDLEARDKIVQTPQWRFSHLLSTNNPPSSTAIDSLTSPSMTSAHSDASADSHSSSFYAELPNRHKTPPKTAAATSTMPLKNIRSKSTPFDGVSEVLETRLAELQAEIAERIVGPIGIGGFSTFFPEVPGTSTTPSEEQIKAFRDLPGKLSNMKDETLMPYTIFDGQEIKPDLMGFKEEYTQTMLEVKIHNSSDPFDDHDPTSFVRSTQEARHTLGQITSYATCHQACQFRTHVFSFLILPTYLRILRWDRSGILVSNKLPFEKITTVLLLLRFVAATLTQLGHDNSLTSKIDLSSAKKDEIRDELGLDAKAHLAKIYIKKR